jgi:CHAD domain-containing protein
MAGDTLVQEREIERTYDVGDDFRLPDLEALPGVAAVSRPQTQTLRAVYFDTDDLRLASRGISLRRRTGGEDAGWHVKLPAPDGGRDEIRAPAGRATKTVPPPLLDLVKAYTRGAPLRPIARISTVRMSRRLLGEDGTVLAELVDDDVSGATLGEVTTLLEWREMEVELKAGGRNLLEAADALLAEGGATVSADQRKLGRLLGDGVRSVPVDAPARRLRPGSPAADVVLAYLREQVDDLQAWDRRVRRDEPDSVHKMRVATRRLRSALQSFGTVVERNRTRELTDELRWLAASLGEVRDLEVLHARLRDAVAALPAEQALGPVAARVTSRFAADTAEARSRLLADLDGPRYFALLDRLDELVADPPLTPRAARKARDVLPRLIRKTWRRLERQMSAAERAAAEQRAEALHEARKSAKRARYAAEAVTGVFGKPAARLGKQAKRLQELLGEHHDGVVAQARLREMAIQAHAAGENAYTLGLLAGQERAAAAHLARRVPAAWAKAARPRNTRWLG